MSFCLKSFKLTRFVCVCVCVSLKFVLKLTTQPEIYPNVFFFSFQAWETNEILVAVHYFHLGTVNGLHSFPSSSF